MRIAVASGKGGTGKTLLATHLAWALARAGESVSYADADVEEPNGHLFLRPEVEREEPFAVPTPAMVPERCSGCGECARACAFHALLPLKDRVLVLPELCHSCGLCVEVCPEKVLEERPRRLGLLRHGLAGQIGFVSGLLDVGEARATPLVTAVVEALPPAVVQVVDAPPGASCSAMAAVKDADLVLLVTEPTPFGLHDLEIVAAMCRALGRRVMVVVNRSDLGEAPVEKTLGALWLPLLASIPFDPLIARLGAEGALAAEASAGLRAALRRILEQLGRQWPDVVQGEEYER